MMRRIFLAAIALVLATPLAAQDGSEVSVQRTPENAQKFLGEFFQRSGANALLQLSKGTGPGLVIRKDDGSISKYFVFSGQVMDWVALDACRSRIEYSNLRTLTADEFDNLPPMRWSYDLDWSKVTAVVRRSESFFSRSGDSTPREQPGKFLLGLAVKGQAGPVFYLDTLEEAERLHFALIFLKDACALKSDTGF